MYIDRVEHDRDTAQAHLMIHGWEPGYWQNGSGIAHPEHGYWYLLSDRASTGYGTIRVVKWLGSDWIPCEWDQLDDAVFWNIINELNRRL